MVEDDADGGLVLCTGLRDRAFAVDLTQTVLPTIYRAHQQHQRQPQGLPLLWDAPLTMPRKPDDHVRRESVCIDFSCSGGSSAYRELQSGGTLQAKPCPNLQMHCWSFPLLPASAFAFVGSYVADNYRNGPTLLEVAGFQESCSSGGSLRA